MVTVQSVATIVVQVLIVQRVVPTEIAIPVQALVHHQTVANAVTVHAIPVRHQIVRHVLMATAQNVVMIVAQVPIVHAEKIHMVAIVHALAMIAMPVRLRVTANAVVVQIVPEVVSPMIAKNAAVALAKSA
jgi:hypothetical protein